MFAEQLVVSRKVDNPIGIWAPPTSQTKPIDVSINDWIDQTGNELVSVSSPGIFMQWMDKERTQRLVISAVMVTYIPSVVPPKPLIS